MAFYFGGIAPNGQPIIFTSIPMMVPIQMPAAMAVPNLVMPQPAGTDQPPELLSPEVSPRENIPESVNVQDPVLNIRFTMRSNELVVTEGLLNYHIKRKAILCNDNHPLASTRCSDGSNPTCTLGVECNQIHVKHDALVRYRNRAIERGATPKHFVKIVYAMDPFTNLAVGFKFGHTEDTAGRDVYRQLAVTDPEKAKLEATICRAFLSEAGCSKRRRCEHVHVRVDQWRRQACCANHMETGRDSKAESSWHVKVNNTLINPEQVSVTKGLRVLGKSSVPLSKAEQKAGGVDSGLVVRLAVKHLCRYHGEGYCKMDAACNSVHVCRSMYPLVIGGDASRLAVAAGSVSCCSSQSSSSAGDKPEKWVKSPLSTAHSHRGTSGQDQSRRTVSSNAGSSPSSFPTTDHLSRFPATHSPKHPSSMAAFNPSCPVDALPLPYRGDDVLRAHVSTHGRLNCSSPCESTASSIGPSVSSDFHPAAVEGPPRASVA
ncbi:hypothetical protein DIPPA_14350 [Diplonema papillatum]|nr:hypothetical protein DIPPA_14350 [Diplonema papillatum]